MSYTPSTASGANLIFSGSYIAPTASGADLIFGEITEVVRQVWTDSNYVYAATSEGLKIHQIISESEYAYIDYSDGFTSVWANNNKVFLGTTNSGVKYINKTCISGSISTPYDLITCLNDLSGVTPHFNLTSNSIIYLHGNDDKLLVITSSGVDVIKMNPQSYKSSTTVSGINKGFMTSSGKFYYMDSTHLYVRNLPINDWTEPNQTYTVGSGIFAAGIELNDLFITEATASNNTDNTIFMATTSGVYVIDEIDNIYSIYYKE